MKNGKLAKQTVCMAFIVCVLLFAVIAVGCTRGAGENTTLTDGENIGTQTPVTTEASAVTDSSDLTIEASKSNLLFAFDDATLTCKVTGYTSEAYVFSFPKYVLQDGKTYTLTAIGDGAFRDCMKLKEILLPESVTYIGSEAFSGCIYLAHITLPAGVTAIGEDAFFNCCNLTDIELPAGLTSISKGTFEYCQKLAHITLPAGVTTIGEVAFFDCRSLTDIVLPAGLTSIGSGAFERCNELKSVTLPTGMTSIGEGVFSCGGLTEIHLPGSVTAISGHAFDCCEDLQSIVFDGTIAEWNAIQKEEDWDYGTGTYTITCTDGVLDKNGAPLSQ